jgi:hypothetical protein
MKVAVNMEGREHWGAVGFAIFDNDPLSADAKADRIICIATGQA